MMNEFEEVMSKRTDAELLKILNSSPGDYQSAALEAAKTEFKKRNLSDEQIVSANEQIKQKQDIDNAKSNEPLAIISKIFAFLFPGILMLLFSGTFKADGYYRKSKEMVRWTLYGLCFYVGFIIVVVLITFLFR